MESWFPRPVFVISSEMLSGPINLLFPYTSDFSAGTLELAHCTCRVLTLLLNTED